MTVANAALDLALVMRVLGHSNAQTAMIYQDPSLEIVRSVINENRDPTPEGHNSRHTDADVQDEATVS